MFVGFQDVFHGYYYEEKYSYTFWMAIQQLVLYGELHYRKNSIIL